MLWVLKFTVTFNAIDGLTMPQPQPKQYHQPLVWRVLGALVLLLTVIAAVWGLRPLWFDSEAVDAPLALREIPERRVAEDAITLFPSVLPSADMSALPDLSEPTDVEARKQAFYDFLLPLIQIENERLLVKRAYLANWLEQLERGTEPDPALLAELLELAEDYYIDSGLSPTATIEQLLQQMDTLPPSMIIAQSANESAWGTSRFATEGNNLFGQWCFTPGCGLVPQNRPEGETYEVRAFASPALSVRAFILNLNRHHSYEDLRAKRALMRAEGRPVTGLDLVPYLINYSIRREEYVAEIAQTIRFNHLQDLD